jgi:hypothetical protein
MALCRVPSFRPVDLDIAYKAPMRLCLCVEGILSFHGCGVQYSGEPPLLHPAKSIVPILPPLLHSLGVHSCLGNDMWTSHLEKKPKRFN